MSLLFLFRLCLDNDTLYLSPKPTSTWTEISSNLIVTTCCFRKQPPEVFYKKGVLENFAKFTAKHLCQSLFLNKIAGLRSAILLKKRLWHRCFPANFAKFSRTPFLQNTSGRLLLCFSIITSWHLDVVRQKGVSLDNLPVNSTSGILSMQ